MVEAKPMSGFRILCGECRDRIIVFKRQLGLHLGSKEKSGGGYKGFRELSVV
jgi:hypothetical protein